MRVLVTRPLSEASAWVEGLQARGFDAVALPLMEVAPVADPAPMVQAAQAWGQWQAVMFVSAAAVRHFFAAVPIQTVSATRCWATGLGTRKALLQAGVPETLIDCPDANAGQFDSEALWQVVASSVSHEKPVLIVRGTDPTVQDPQAQPDVHSNAAAGVGRDWLAHTLHAAGVSVRWVVSYQRRPPRWTSEQVQLAQAALLDGSVWCFSSSQALTFLERLLPRQNWSHTRCIVTHARIASAARTLGFGQISLARPLLEDVVASLESLA